ncbi:hypothetical protein EHQ53_15270 [Leptospira langatensis]|uniref:Uncharacterized protein n=1 Tax=Leptospira langatensis TaxID=2484983 RepID=A0A5F1ZSE6_9LEPT|nr:hypothetical protein [Leptospira langatensis]TGK01830.1 hypothetical protein EHO57_08510 [Leptospira langatensis]TGL39435.1 hypothetical protein EHQ53_15270 [Leptospira langatensis]
MSETKRSNQTLKSVGALLAGFFFIIVLSIGTDMILHFTNVYPPFGIIMSDPLFILAASYRLAYGILGSYIAARLAPSRPMFHAMILGSVGLVISIAGAIMMGDKGPAWYSILIILIALPSAWAGGILVQGRRPKTA